MTEQELRKIGHTERIKHFLRLDHEDQLDAELAKGPLADIQLTESQANKLCEFFHDGSGTGAIQRHLIKNAVHQQLMDRKLLPNFLPLAMILIKAVLESEGNLTRSKDGSAGSIHNGVAPMEKHPKDVVVIGPGVGYPVVREDKAQ